MSEQQAQQEKEQPTTTKERAPPKELTKEEIEIQNKWIEIQNELKKQLIEVDDFKFKIDNIDGSGDGEIIKYIGGVDISFVKDNEEDACASLIVLEYPSLQIVYKDIEFVKLSELYIPGFLAFRETPHLIKLVDRLKQSSDNHHLMPQLIMVDGNGILHPRGFGLASHLGVLLNIPTIGVGKTFFHVDNLSTKEIKKQVETKRVNAIKNGGGNGDDIDICVELVGDSGRIWGTAVLSNKKCKNPIYVSIGHRISLESALKIVKLTSLNRVPESIRQADLLSRDYIRINYKP